MRAAPTEIEWQFDALDLRPVQRWLTANGLVAGPATVKRQRDRYVDTADWRLHRAGYSLRIRRAGRAAEATLKSLGLPQEGLRHRVEISEPLDGDDPTALTGEVGMRVRALAGAHGLRPVGEVRTVRRTFPLVVDGAVAGDLALDDTTIPVDDGAPARIRRVEVETRGEPSPAVRRLVQQMQLACGLRPATLSKFESALLATGQAPPELDLGPLEYGSGSTIGEVAFAVLRTQLAAILRHEGGTRLGEDPEELHDMRVATRRLRAALSLFAPALPVRAARYRQEFGWVADALGDVRDLDVQIAELPGLQRRTVAAAAGAFEPLRGSLERDRQSARTALLAVLDSRRYERLIQGFTLMLRHGPLRRSPASRAPVLASAPDLVATRFRKVRAAGKLVDRRAAPEPFHRLRIRCKRLRYALEFVEPVYGDPVRPLITSLVALQDLLGKHQDAVVAVRRLQALCDAHGDMPAVTLFAMGAAAEEYERQAQKLRKRGPKLIGRLGGRAWRTLSRTMERSRPLEQPSARPQRPTLQSVSAESGAPPPPGLTA